MSGRIPPMASKKIDMTIQPASIVAEMVYRDFRIIQTNDPKWVGVKDSGGFSITSGFVVRDAFDDPVLPIGLGWFYTWYDAINAIEMMDTVLPMIKEGQAATSMLYEYGLMMQYHRQFWQTYAALVSIQKLCDDAVSFEENPASEIQALLHKLRQNLNAKNGVA